MLWQRVSGRDCFTQTEEANTQVRALRGCWKRTVSKPAKAGEDGPYDNDYVESFFATAKKELIFRKQYDKMEDVEAIMIT